MRILGVCSIGILCASASLAAEPAKVRGFLAEAGDGGVLFLGEVRKEPIPLSVEKRHLLDKAPGLPFVITFKKGLPAGKVEVDRLDFDAVDRWSTDKGQFADPKFTDLGAAMSEFREVASRWQTHGATDADLLAKAGAAKEQLGLAFLDTKDTDKKQRDALVLNYLSLSRTRKAFYGRIDVFPPATYQRIYASTHAAVGVAVKATSAVICSGILVGKDTLFTAAHCFDKNEPAELEAWLNFDGDDNGTSRDAYPITGVTRGTRLGAAPGAPVLDYALVKVGPGANGKLPGETVALPCLSTRRLQRDEPVYLVGHPRGWTKMVHDNAFVLFPYRVTRAELGDLELAVEAELRGLGESGAARAKDLKQFVDSYVPVAADAGTPMYQNYSLRWERQPTIGVDSDTSHGNSGSALFSRTDRLVLGLLFAGEDDVDVPWKPGWKAHEAVLPMSEVVSQLDATQPGWRAGVCVMP